MKSNYKKIILFEILVQELNRVTDVLFVFSFCFGKAVCTVFLLLQATLIRTMTSTVMNAL